MATNMEDHFHNSCTHYAQYPVNLLGHQYAKSQLSTLAEQVKRDSKRLFDSEDPVLNFVEVYDGAECM
jgi:hypothetical protein